MSELATNQRRAMQMSTPRQPIRGELAAVVPHALCAEGAELCEASASVFVCGPGGADRTGPQPRCPANNALFFYFSTAAGPASPFLWGGVNGRGSMNSQCYTVAMDLGVCQLRNFSISFLSSVLGKESASVRLDNR